jgi:hypothetical protein
MARMIPNQVLPQRSPAYARMVRLCKTLPDSFTIWQQVHPEAGPDLLLFFNECQYVPLRVSDISLQELRDYMQRDLFGNEVHPLEKKRALLQAENERLVPVFPLLEPAAVLQLDLGVPRSLSREALQPEAFAEALAELLSDPLSDEEASVVREAFCPEVVIPDSLSVRPLVDRNLNAGLTHLLLDIDQEAILKTDLQLEAPGERLAEALNVRLVTGVAGSGKSLLVLYRLRMLRELLGPRQRMLVLTHNRALIRDLEGRYLILSAGDRGVEFKTFLAWCHDNWPNGFPWNSPISNRERLGIVQQCIAEHLQGTSIKPDMLLDEIDWCKDSFKTRQEYLTADRTGRGFRLTEELRQRVYAAIVQYQKTLDESRLMDWGDVPRKLWQSVESGETQLPKYDAIFVDEAQFFAPYWFTILKTCFKPHTGHLFIVADPTQGFLKRRHSWAALGLEVRGRAQRLDRSYRTTKSIMTFANLLYRDRSPDDQDAILAPDLSAMPAGVMPTVIPLSSPQDELSRVVNEIEALLERGTPRNQILVVHADSGGVKPLIARLNKAHGETVADDPRYTHEKNIVRVCSLGASTGLESTIVFLLGIHRLYEKEQSVYLSEEERAELIRTNTRKLYMAITRTGQRLVITYVGVLPTVLMDLVRR